MPALELPDPPPGDGVVVLRGLRLEDAPALVEGANDAAVRRFTSQIPHPYGEGDALDWIGRQPRLRAGGREAHFAIASAADDALLGMTGVHHVDHAAGRALCGYWVGPRHRRAGVATRALRLLVAWATTEAGLPFVGLYADVENVASHRVAEGAGLVRVGEPVRHPIGGREREAFRFELPVRQ